MHPASIPQAGWIDLEEASRRTELRVDPQLPDKRAAWTKLRSQIRSRSWEIKEQEAAGKDVAAHSRPEQLRERLKTLDGDISAMAREARVRLRHALMDGDIGAFEVRALHTTPVLIPKDRWREAVSWTVSVPRSLGAVALGREHVDLPSGRISAGAAIWVKERQFEAWLKTHKPAALWDISKEQVVTARLIEMDGVGRIDPTTGKACALKLAKDETGVTLGRHSSDRAWAAFLTKVNKPAYSKAGRKPKSPR